MSRGNNDSNGLSNPHPGFSKGPPEAEQPTDQIRTFIFIRMYAIASVRRKKIK